MPSVSKAQSKKLNAKFGHAWVKAHGYDNSTKGLPEHVRKKKTKKRPARKRSRAKKR